MPPSSAPFRSEVIWAGGFMQGTLAERVAAAAACGCPGLAILTGDFAELGHDRARAREAAARAADQGVTLHAMEAVTDWYPLDPDKPLRLRPTPAAEVLDAAEGFGCKLISVVPAFPAELSMADFAERYAAVCDAAAERGISATLEFTFSPPVQGLRLGWEVVRLADRKNGGLTFDSWHFFKGGEPDFDLLAAIPGERIFAVQVSDGLAQVVESPLKDTFLHRRLPGEGAFELQRAFRILRDTGGLRGIGPEVCSREEGARPLAEQAARACGALDKVLAGLDADA
jgi:sugar phosphate isomerase/epimerase